MKLNIYKNSSSVNGTIVFFSCTLLLIFLIVIIARIFGFSYQQLINTYLFLPRYAANQLMAVFQVNVTINTDSVLFSEHSFYTKKYHDILANWQSFMLFKKWLMFTFLLIGITGVSIHKKALYFFRLLAVHQFAVFTALVIAAGIAPLFIHEQSLTELRVHLIGVLLFIYLIAHFTLNNFDQLKITFSSLRIPIHLEYKKLLDFFIVLAIFSLIKNLVVPFINFYGYVHFLLFLTQKLVSVFGYAGKINGAYFIGDAGTLFMAKWCLGFLTMYVFSAFVYLTSNKNKVAWKYIAFGIVLLHVLNVIRLSMLFIFVQHNSAQKASHHHELYNIIIYLVIFVMWVIWIEKYSPWSLRKTNKS